RRARGRGSPCRAPSTSTGAAPRARVSASARRASARSPRAVVANRDQPQRTRRTQSRHSRDRGAQSFLLRVPYALCGLPFFDVRGVTMPGSSASPAPARTDHVGSLLRPKALIDAFLARGRGEIGDDELRRLEDDAIREVLRKQEAHGLPYVTDGEYRRLNWQVSFSEVSGWDLWEISWKGFLKNPGNLSPQEKPLTK